MTTVKKPKKASAAEIQKRVQKVKQYLDISKELGLTVNHRTLLAKLLENA